jgi:hypothetical protein
MALSLLTVGTVNHAAGIRVVMETFAEHHPGAQLFTCLVDGGVLRGGDLRLPGVVFLPEDLPLPGGRRFLFKFDAFELCTALKAFAASHVLERYNVDKLVYLDSDIMVFASLADSLATGWRAGNILCTPHFIEWPEESPEILRQVRQYGTYNTGFFAVDRSFETTRFLSWWGTLCSEMGIFDPASGRFVDQIWLDLVVAERHGIVPLLDPGLNVAYWNMAERLLAKEGSQWLVNRQRLRFFHFSGFDPNRLTGRREVTPTEAHLAIAREYLGRLRAAGLENLRDIPYGFGTYSDHAPILVAHRRAIFRNEPSLVGVVDPFNARDDLNRATAQVTRKRRILERIRNRAARAWRGEP